ncbi:MAG: ATP-dependent helicase [Verrucomicrobiales bacterium]|nr:ATP-dependent helicase [Verrucomicrobiales bacterium]
MAVKGLANTLVVAGPGAGKTELLAQRACYLLKTGICPYHRRILAISFKRDAAKNLRERVKLRCGDELARRFDSLTFDAFSKGLLDRFQNGLPTNFRPSREYQLNFNFERRMRDLLDSLPSRDNGLTIAQMKTIGDRGFYRDHFLAAPLAIPLPTPSTITEAAAQELWKRLVRTEQPSQLDFPMIGRLAELIIRKNDLLLNALRATYAFVFLDEFQDTTNIHYDLTATAFRDSGAILTAVGDDKQRIMGWAGALKGIFEQFKNDFGATVESLLINHRSAPELIRIQHFLIQALDPAAPMPEHSEEKSQLAGECRVIIYPDHNAEASHVAEMVAGWIHQDGLHPRDICLLTRQTPDHYTKPITDALRAKSIESRVENDLQDLLVEPLTVVLLAFLRIALVGRSAIAWNAARAALFDTRGIDTQDPKAADSERSIALYCELLGQTLTTTPAEDERLRPVLAGILDFIGSDPFRNFHPQYRRGSFYEETLTNLIQRLIEARKETNDWLDALNHFEGLDSVPIMTVHKSKGLEYHTIIFIGLEDSALWGFRRAPVEETCAFFVAFSRAIARVVFTFSELRPNRRTSSIEGQSRDAIDSLYALLRQAGVTEEHHDGPAAPPSDHSDIPF